jgi:hypothetical protein
MIAALRAKGAKQVLVFGIVASAILRSGSRISH